MIDFGFSRDSAALIDSYFAVMIAVVARARACERGALLPRHDARRAHRGRPARARCSRHLVSLSPAYFDSAKTGELISRLTADTTQIKAAVGASVSVALRNLVLFVGAAAMMVVTSPRLSAFVLAAIPVIVLPLLWLRPRGPPPLARGAGHACRCVRLCVGTDRRDARAAGLHQRERWRAAVSAPRSSALSRPPAIPPARAILTAIAIFLVFASVVVVLWVGAQDVLAGRMSAGRLVPIRALCGVRRRRPGPALRGLGRDLAGLRRGGAVVRDPATCGR